MQIDFDIDTRDLNQLAVRVSRIKDRFEDTLSRSMNYAAYDAQKKLRKLTPDYVDQPTPWTQKATFVEPSTSATLAVRLGFKDTAVKGTPAAQYLQPMVAGQRRPLKGSERALQSMGALRSYEYIVPAEARPRGGVPPLKLNQFGNVPGPQMVKILSRLKALEFGSASTSRRSRRKGAQQDYFIGEPGGLPRGIYARVGPKPSGSGRGRPVTSNLSRGFHTVFNITRQPRYRSSFPVRDIVRTEFSARFPSIFERLVFGRT